MLLIRLLMDTSAAVRSYPRAMCRVNVHTLAITTTMGATPTVRLWVTPALSSIPLSSDLTSVGGDNKDK